MKEYLDIVRKIFYTGDLRSGRNGPTLSLFGLSYRLPIYADEFPLLTTKKVSWRNIVTELCWFISGDDNVSTLNRHGVRFWDPWSDRNGWVANGYGPRWRHPVDQIARLVTDLKDNPYSRRMVVDAWRPGDGDGSDLVPCHYSFVVTTHRNRLNLCLMQRSCDVGLGLPYNIASYALLMLILCRLSGFETGCFVHQIADAHVYLDHIEGLSKQLVRTPYSPPKVVISDQVKSLNDIYRLLYGPTDEMMDAFRLEQYRHHPAIELPVSV